MYLSPVINDNYDIPCFCRFLLFLLEKFILFLHLLLPNSCGFFKELVLLEVALSLAAALALQSFYRSLVPLPSFYRSLVQLFIIASQHPSCVFKLFLLIHSYCSKLSLLIHSYCSKLSLLLHSYCSKLSLLLHSCCSKLLLLIQLLQQVGLLISAFSLPLILLLLPLHLQ